MKIFLLEDDGTRTGLIREALLPSGITLHHTPTVEGPGGAIDIFSPPYDLMLLDHDLGGAQYVSQNDPETGTNFVKWLIEMHPGGSAAADTIVHSYNTGAAQWMVDTLNENGYQAIYRPFGLRLLNFLRALIND